MRCGCRPCRVCDTIGLSLCLLVAFLPPSAWRVYRDASSRCAKRSAYIFKSTIIRFRTDVVESISVGKSVCRWYQRQNDAGPKQKIRAFPPAPINNEAFGSQVASGNPVVLLLVSSFFCHRASMAASSPPRVLRRHQRARDLLSSSLYQ